MNMEMLAIAVICLLILPLFYVTVSFNSRNGILLFVMGFSAFFLRLLFLKNNPPLATLNKDTLPLSLTILLIPLGLFMAFTFLKKGSLIFNKWCYLLKMMFAYLFFGALQQIFFLAVFTDSVYYLFSNRLVTYLISVVFFFSIHLSMSKELRKFLPGVFFFGMLNTYIYLWLGNIYPQMILHGIFGSIVYALYTDTDYLKKRLQAMRNVS